MIANREYTDQAVSGQQVRPNRERIENAVDCAIKLSQGNGKSISHMSIAFYASRLMKSEDLADMDLFCRVIEEKFNPILNQLIPIVDGIIDVQLEGVMFVADWKQFCNNVADRIDNMQPLKVYRPTLLSLVSDRIQAYHQRKVHGF